MAKKEDLNLGAGKAEAEAPKGKGKLLLIVAAAVILLAGGGGAWFMLGAGDREATDGAAVAEAPKEEQREAVYLPLEKFLVNFDHKGGIRYIQTDIQLMAYDPKILDRVQRNMPAVRNRVIMLLSDQDFDALRTVAGKEALRKDVLAAVNEVLKLKGTDAVQEAFFTSFVLQ